MGYGVAGRTRWRLPMAMPLFFECVRWPFGAVRGLDGGLLAAQFIDCGLFPFLEALQPVGRRPVVAATNKKNQHQWLHPGEVQLVDTSAWC